MLTAILYGLWQKSSVGQISQNIKKPSQAHILLSLYCKHGQRSSNRGYYPAQGWVYIIREAVEDGMESEKKEKTRQFAAWE
jgi:hypothetical protein